MFPLGQVLLPGGVIPLRLFEPRYLQMYQDLVRGDGRFGVVLIERGAETGGGDIRFGTGCEARMVGAAPQEDGTVLTVNVGVSRIGVVRWLEEDPYPRALVETREEAAVSEGVEALVTECRARFVTVRALASELGADVGEDPELSGDPVRATFEISYLAPIALLDRQRLLESDDPLRRAAMLSGMLADLAQSLRLELALGR